jgi:phenylalanyl-tRNA synthetase alpha chain
MKESLQSLREEILGRIRECASEQEVQQLRVDYLGRKGRLTLLLRGLRELPADERPQVGEQLNATKEFLEEQVQVRIQECREREKQRVLHEERVDVTLPGSRFEHGRVHPIVAVMDEIIDVFWGMGYEVARGPDIEDDYHNFEALNFPKDHPARDMQDTFFVSGGFLLRTHTSPVQIRVMKQRQPPLQVIVPGTVYRHDDDLTHSPMFHQVEGFMVDAGIDRRAISAKFFSFYRTERRSRYPMRALRRERCGSRAAALSCL